MVMPYVKNDDVLVRYETFGDETNLPLVLIFGISMTCEDWLELGYISGLAKDISCRMCRTSRARAKHMPHEFVLLRIAQNGF